MQFRCKLLQRKSTLPRKVMMAAGQVDLRRVRQKPRRHDVADRPALRGHRQRHCPRRPTFSRQKICRRRWRLEVVEGPVTNVRQLGDPVGQEGAAEVAAAARAVIRIRMYEIPSNKRSLSS